MNASRTHQGSHSPDQRTGPLSPITCGIGILCLLLLHLSFILLSFGTDSWGLGEKCLEVFLKVAFGKEQFDDSLQEDKHETFVELPHLKHVERSDHSSSRGLGSYEVLEFVCSREKKRSTWLTLHLNIESPLLLHCYYFQRLHAFLTFVSVSLLWGSFSLFSKLKS